MNPTTGQNMVLISGVGIVSIELLKNAIDNQTLDIHELIGAGIAFTMLAGLAELAPGVAGTLSLAALLAVFLKDGGPVLNKLLSIGGTTPQPGRKQRHG